MSAADPPPSDSVLLMPLALVGSIALVLALYSLGAWAFAERDFQPFRERGVVVTARVGGKSEQVTRTRTGASSTFRLYVAFDFGGDGRGPRRIHTSLTDHVYYGSYARLSEGDDVELLVLPEDPESHVMLREVVESSAYRPVTLLSWTPLVTGLISLGCFLLYRRLTTRG